MQEECVHEGIFLPIPRADPGATNLIGLSCFVPQCPNGIGNGFGSRWLAGLVGSNPAWGTFYFPSGPLYVNRFPSAPRSAANIRSPSEVSLVFQRKQNSSQ